MASPSIPDILARKRDGQELTQEEIQAFVNAVVNDGAQKEQIGEQLFFLSLTHISMHGGHADGPTFQVKTVLMMHAFLINK